MLTDKQKLEFFHRALCNVQGYGQIRVGLAEQEIDDAKKHAKVFSPAGDWDTTACIEDVFMAHLVDKRSFVLYDEYEMESITLTYEEIMTNIDNGLPVESAIAFIQEQDDAITADEILQAAAFGEIIYG
jgi:hypothetical protein